MSIKKLKQLIGESEQVRHGNLSGKKKEVAKKMKKRNSNFKIFGNYDPMKEIDGLITEAKRLKTNQDLIRKNK